MTLIFIQKNPTGTIRNQFGSSSSHVGSTISPSCHGYKPLTLRDENSLFGSPKALWVMESCGWDREPWVLVAQT